MSETKEKRGRYYTLLRLGHNDLMSNLCGWDDEQYRELLQRCGATLKNGKYSATTMNLKQLDDALNEIKRLGFKPKKSKSSGANWRAPRIAKLNAMWIALADAGVVENRSEEAMHRWCQNQVPGLGKLQWATSQQLNKAIEMMKSMTDQRELDRDLG